MCVRACVRVCMCVRMRVCACACLDILCVHLYLDLHQLDNSSVTSVDVDWSGVEYSEGYDMSVCPQKSSVGKVDTIQGATDTHLLEYYGPVYA